MALLKKPRAWAVSVLLSTAILVSGPAFSCAFDMVKPERTKIDWIVDSEVLVLARPNQEDPFTFNVTQVLTGEYSGSQIGQLVDSITRQRLAANLSATVLFAHDPDNGWRRVAFVDESFRSILDTTLEHRLAWQTGMPQSRLEFITELQDSPVPQHRAIVIGELDKVPYADLRKMDLQIPSEELLGDLWTLEGYPYQAIRALLLGLSGKPAARAKIHDYIIRVEDRN